MANRNKKNGFYNFGGASSPTSLLSGSKAIFLAFLGVVIGGAFFLTGGNPFPKEQLSTPENPEAVYEIDEESLRELDNTRGNLQLKTIRFKECKGQASAALLVDRSGSMEFGNKLPNLKQALNRFLDQMGDSSVTGLISYSQNVTENVPIDLFSNNSTQMRSAITSLHASGATQTRSAFNLAIQRLITAQQRFPDKQHNLVFLSDGIPESIFRTCTAPACSPDRNRCFETTQDPTNTSISGGDLAQQIKNSGIRIFAIALFDSRDTCFQNDLKDMMQRIASEDSYYETPNPENLDQIYNEISTKICNSVGGNS